MPFLPDYIELIHDYTTNISFFVKSHIVEEINQIELEVLRKNKEQYGMLIVYV